MNWKIVWKGETFENCVIFETFDQFFLINILAFLKIGFFFSWQHLVLLWIWV